MLKLLLAKVFLENFWSEEKCVLCQRSVDIDQKSHILSMKIFLILFVPETSKNISNAENACETFSKVDGAICQQFNKLKILFLCLQNELIQSFMTLRLSQFAIFNLHSYSLTLLQPKHSTNINGVGL